MPIGAWKKYQRQAATEAEILRWYSSGLTGVGAVMGAVSGNTELFEFDDEETFDQFLAAAESAGIGALIERVRDGYEETTPNGGVHWLIRCDQIGGNTKLARRPKRPDEQADGADKVKTLIETKGEGGFVILAPSNGKVHPTGREYILRRGGFDSIATLTARERAILHAMARTFDQMPMLRPMPEVRPINAEAGRPGDDFAARATWAEILEPHGWQAAYRLGDVTAWWRPGKGRGQGVSATTNYAGTDYLYVFSTSTVFESERAYSKFSAYALLNHNNDFRAAARELAAQGFGRPEDDGVRIFFGHEADGADAGEDEPDQDATEDSPRRYTLHWAREAWEPQPPVECLVDPLFARGSLSLIFGPPGGGKTYAMLDCIACIALGLPWLNFETTQAGILIIDEESGPRRMKRRLKEVMTARDAPDEVPIAFTTLEGFNLRDVRDHRHIESAIEESGAGFVLMDALADFTPGADENDVKDMLPLMLVLKRIAERRQIHIAMIHHANKSGGVRGSISIPGVVDLVLSVEKKAKSPRIDFVTTKARDIEETMFSALFTHDRDEQSFRLEPAQRPPEGDDDRLSASQKYVLHYLLEHGPSLVTTIANTADVCSPDTAKRALYRLAERGRIRRCDSGESGEKAVYEIVRNDRF